VQSSQHTPDFSLASFVVLDGTRDDQQLVEGVGVPGGLSGKSRRIAEKGMKILLTSHPS